MKHLMRLVCVVLIAAALSSATVVHGLPAIAGTGVVVQVSALNLTVQYITATAPSTNTGIARFGGSDTSSSIGQYIAAGGSYTTPAGPQLTYNLSQHYVYVANGDTIQLSYGQ